MLRFGVEKKKKSVITLSTKGEATKEKNLQHKNSKNLAYYELYITYTRFRIFCIYTKKKIEYNSTK